MRPRKKTARRKPQQFTWRPMAFLGARVTRKDARELFLYVSGDGDERWIALALEGPSEDDPIAVLDDHGHRLVGAFANPDAARRAAEGFGRRWLRGAKIDECRCDVIGTKTKASRR